MNLIRKPNSKWYLGYNELIAKFYLLFCAGAAYIFQGNLATSLNKASLHTQHLKMFILVF